MQINIQPHTRFDKKFNMEGEDLFITFPYDDEDHAMVDASAEYLKTLIEMHWDKEELNVIYKKQAYLS